MQYNNNDNSSDNGDEEEDNNNNTKKKSDFIRAINIAGEKNGQNPGHISISILIYSLSLQTLPTMFFPMVQSHQKI